MPPASRITDMHTCPMVTPGVPPIPHVGGPILPPGAPTVLIDFLPAATVTTMATCVGPPDVIVKGSTGVMINFLPAARLGDQTAHGGVIVMGSPTCIIGETGSASAGAGGLGGVMAGLAQSGGTQLVSNASKYSQPGTAGSTSSSDQQSGTNSLNTAQAFYSQTGWSDAKIQSHLDCIDETAPVSVVTLPPGTVVKQWVDPKYGPGNYFDGDEPPERLGIYPASFQPRVLQTFVVTRETQVLVSKAKGTTVNWVPGLPPTRVPGGGAQMFSLPRDSGNFQRIGG